MIYPFHEHAYSNSHPLEAYKLIKVIEKREEGRKEKVS